MFRKQIAFVIFIMALLSMAMPVTAGVPDSLVTFQGELQGSDGTPVPDGFHTIVFSLFTQPDGGVPVWSELQDISTSNGLFSVMLGRHTPFSNSTFDNDSLFLSVQVAGGAELLPRLRIGTVPFAVKSNRIDGDVVTNPGSMIIWSPQSNRSLNLQATDEAASIAIDEPGVHLTQMVSPDSTVFDQGSDSGNRVMIHKIHAGEKRLSQIIYPDSLVIDESTNFGSSSAGNELHLSSSGARRNYHYAHVDAINDVDEDCDGFAAKHAINTKGTGAQTGRTATVSSRTTLDSAGNVCSLDLDGDGVANNSASTDVSTSSASRRLEVRNLGSSGEDGVEVTLNSVHKQTDVDTDGNGNPEAEAVSSVSSLGGGASAAAYARYAVDRDDNGEDDCDGAFMVTPTSSSMAIKTKGTGADKDRVVAACSTGSGGSASLVCDHDSDGDGIPDLGISFDSKESKVQLKTYFEKGDVPTQSQITNTVDSASARLAIKTKGTGAQRFSSGGDCDDTDASLHTDYDSDGDGLAESFTRDMSTADSVTREVSYGFTNSLLMPALMKAKEKANRTKCSNNLRYSDPVSTVESDISCDSATARFLLGGATSMSGTPGGGSISFLASADSVNQQVDVSSGSSSSSYNLRTRINELESRLQAMGVLGVSSVSSACRPASASLAIQTKGTSAKRLMAGGDCDDTDASLHADCDDDDDGIVDRSAGSSVDDSASVVSASQGALSVSMRTRKGWDGTIKGNLRVSSGSTDVVDLDSDGDGYFAGKIGVGVAEPIHHIDVAGGAYCDGSNWVNASDANLKENFSEVNGEELLSKIDELPVTEWNYKNENTNVKHIGPTAQDFQRTFGVGSDGKSISTIDPSGIALAAIKELNKQNQQLKDQNSELQQRLDDLQKKVDRLISRQ